MLRSFVALLWMCFAVSAAAKLGETVPQLVKRFGKSYTVEEGQLGKTYKFRSANVSVDAVVSNGRSICEIYYSDHPLTAGGEPPNDIVRAVLKTNVPEARWLEIDAAQFGADYALRSSDGEYVAILNYTGPQPENMIWTMTVGRGRSVQTLSAATTTSPSPASTAAADERPVPPLPTPSPSEPGAGTEPASSADSEFYTGDRYYNGDGVKKNYAEAAKWYRKAAEQNHVRAQLSLAGCYYYGMGVPKNYAEAAKWFRKAAEQNLPLAQLMLGVCYNNGEGVRKNYADAAKWYRKAAEQNLDEAQQALGNLYYNGLGVPKDYSEALKWYRKAAEQNHAGAQFDLGRCYYMGLGVPKDYVEAYKWLLLAAAHGEGLSEVIAALENRMSREQIAEGQKLARNFKPREVPSAGANSSAQAIAQTRPRFSGTGFFITEDGYLITNEHVVGNETQVRLVTASGLISAKLVKVDAADDLALLKAERNPFADLIPGGAEFEALPVAASRAVKLGGTVVTVGFPNIGLQGFAPKFARGEIASLSGPQDDPRFFQMSVPLQPGNSGGALVDEHGNVIGIVSAKLSAAAALKATGELPENVNYAVKSSFLLGFLESIPEVTANLKDPNTSNMQSAELVEKVKGATVLVLVY